MVDIGECPVKKTWISLSQIIQSLLEQAAVRAGFRQPLQLREMVTDGKLLALLVLSPRPLVAENIIDDCTTTVLTGSRVRDLQRSNSFVPCHVVILTRMPQRPIDHVVGFQITRNSAMYRHPAENRGWRGGETVAPLRCFGRLIPREPFLSARSLVVERG